MKSLKLNDNQTRHSRRKRGKKAARDFAMCHVICCKLTGQLTSCFIGNRNRNNYNYNLLFLSPLQMAVVAADVFDHRELVSNSKISNNIEWRAGAFKAPLEREQLVGVGSLTGIIIIIIISMSFVVVTIALICLFNRQASRMDASMADKKLREPKQTKQVRVFRDTKAQDYIEFNF